MSRFVILGARRSGSNLLCSLLNSHPDVCCHHELFNPRVIFYALDQRAQPPLPDSLADRDADPLAFLERIWEVSDSPVTGFKITTGQAQETLDAVVADVTVSKIVVERKNRLKAYASEQIAERLDEWEVYSTRALATPRPRVTLSPDGLQSYLTEADSFYHELKGRLRASGQRWLALAYEDLLLTSTHERCLQFLGVDPLVTLSSPSVKQNSRDLRDLLANFEGLRAALAGTPLEQELLDRHS